MPCGASTSSLCVCQFRHLRVKLRTAALKSGEQSVDQYNRELASMSARSGTLNTNCIVHKWVDFRRRYTAVSGEIWQLLGLGRQDARWCADWCDDGDDWSGRFRWGRPRCRDGGAGEGA